MQGPGATGATAVNGVATGGGVGGGTALEARGSITTTGNLSVAGDGTALGDFSVEASSPSPADRSGPTTRWPQDEEYLPRSFVESPDVMNVYNGIATLDESDRDHRYAGLVRDPQPRLPATNS